MVNYELETHLENYWRYEQKLNDKVVEHNLFCKRRLSMLADTINSRLCKLKYSKPNQDFFFEKNK